MNKREFEAAKRMITAKVAEIRDKKNAELAARGFKIVQRRELNAGDVVVAPATFADLFTVADVLAAKARGYVVVTGTDTKGQPYRTSGHVLDEVTIRVR